MIHNEWEKLADDAPEIQTLKNSVLNDVLLGIINKSTDTNRKETTRIFDYGCGWGEWIHELYRGGYRQLEAYDEADEMVSQAKSKFGEISKFYTKEEFKNSLSTFHCKYDIVTSNLVLCILETEQQNEMLNNIKSILKPDGTLIISLCHPCFDYDPESIVSTRTSPDNAIYSEKFTYEKVIRENGLHFHDLHRPLEYFSKLFKDNNLLISEIFESKVFETKHKPDFIIFKLKVLS